MNKPYEVIIIGGSYAGLSAAMALGRSLRRTLVIDGGDPCNKRAPASHNFITQDGRSPAAITADARTQVLAYDTVSWLDDRVTQLSGRDNAFTLTTAAGASFSARKVLFATGLHDELPRIPGLAECWGISAIHCPYCHGYEVRGQPTAILMNTEHTLGMVQLIRNWTDDLILFTNGPADFDVANVEASGVEVVEAKVTALQQEAGELKAILVKDGRKFPRTAMYLHPRLSQKCPLPGAAGCTLNEHGFVVVDEYDMTSVPGLYAAGDCTTMMRSVAFSVGSGNRSGAMINHALIID